MITENEQYPDERIITLYLDGPRLLEDAITGLSDAGLDAAPDAENWSIRQAVHHLVDGDDMWSLAVKMALGGSEVLFDLHWYWQISQAQWARNWAYARREVGPALALFAASRRYVVDLVKAVPGAWDCSVLVPWPNSDAGRLAVGEILAMQARHVGGHIEEIRKIRQIHRI
jgi:hypothetical protein